MYLTYDEYTGMGGSTLDETTFEQLEFEARTVIDWWTFNRLHRDTEYSEAVKRCMYKLITLIHDKQMAMVLGSEVSTDSSVKQAGIASESNDGVSTSYNTLSAKEAVDTLKAELQDAVRMYLTGVKNSLGQVLLYRGVYPNE